MSTGSGKLIATNEPTVLAKPFFDPIVVQESEGKSCFLDPTRADESNGLEVFGESDNLFNQFVTSETGPRRWGR